MPLDVIDERFLALADAAGCSAGCDRGRSGCVVVLDGLVVTRGWAQPPRGSVSCDEAGHLLRHVSTEEGTSSHCVRLVHAEQGAIAAAARAGVALAGATFYCTMEPCRSCAMSVVAAGAARVVARRRYHAGADARAILAAAGVELVVALAETVRYPG